MCETGAAGYNASMKLYLAPRACSLAVDIVARELHIPLELEWVDVRAKRLRDGSDYYRINPKGQVPTLGLTNGQFLTEGSVIVQYRITSYNVCYTKLLRMSTASEHARGAK